MPTKIVWSGERDVSRNMGIYGERVIEVARATAAYFAPQIEAAAKTDAPWTDRTGNARQGLTGLAQDISETAVAIYLYHKMDYGKWLEVRWSGRYAVILPTLERFYEPIMRHLQAVLK